MNDEESNINDYPTAESLEELEYNDTTKNATFPIDTILDESYKVLNKCLEPEYRELFFIQRKPSPIVKSRLKSFSSDTFGLFQSHRKFFTDLINPVFWLTHLQISHPNQNKDIKDLRSTVGTKWSHFLFPLETDISISNTLRDSFINCIPYFFTQCIQHLFILILKGRQPSILQSFRMVICSDLVKTFTHIEPLDSLLVTNLTFYFRTSPEVKINISDQTEKQKFEEPPSSLLPEEDLSTLIEMPHRKRPRNTFWNAAGISLLVSESTHRKTVPFEHSSNIVIQYPKDGEKDWTTDLPPLLPGPVAAASSVAKDDYNPNKETRSLLFRSRRPEILVDYNKMKQEFNQKIVLKKSELDDKKNELQQLQKKIVRKPIIVLKKFTDDLRTLQLERKWSETPELYKKKELERMEEERKKKQEKERIEAEREKRLKRIQRRKEKEEEQDKKDQEQRKVMMKDENKKK